MKPSDPFEPLRFVLPVLVIYGIASAVGLHFHELFLDEAHHFLVSRDSSSLRELYYNLRFDGHPRLWGVLLFLITHYVTASPAGMQVLQWLFAMAAAFVFLRYGPFLRWTKLLILAGYYLIFEYDLLSRNYAIGIWLLFLCCHLLRDPRKNAWWIGTLVFLMCNVHLFFAMASAGILLFVLVDFIERRRDTHVADDPVFRRPRAIGRFSGLVGLIAAGLLAALIQVRVPSADNANMMAVHPAGWLSRQNLSFSMNALIQGWLPIPQLGSGRFWNSCWLTAGHLGPVLPVVLFAALLLFPAYALRKRRPALFFYYGSLAPLLLFFDVAEMTAARYFGMVFIFFIAAAWMTADGNRRVLARWAVPATALGRGWRMAWVAILIIQVLVGAYAYTEDLRRPFSQSQNAAEFLQSLRPAGFPVVVDGYTAGPMLCAYLGTKLYYLTTGGPGSFCVWREEYFPNPRQGIAEELADRPGLRRYREFILVSNRLLGADSTLVARQGYRLTPLSSFENSIAGENYFIYKVCCPGDAGHPLH